MRNSKCKGLEVGSGGRTCRDVCVCVCVAGEVLRNIKKARMANPVGRANGAHGGLRNSQGPAHKGGSRPREEFRTFFSL